MFAQTPIAPAATRMETPAPQSTVDSAPMTDATPTKAAPAPNADREVRLGPGDLLEIRVYGVPDLSQDMRVSASGELDMPLIGTVNIGGMTPRQAENELETRLKGGGFLKDPHVTIFPKELATQGITVLGEVQKPGIYPMLGARRLFDMISAAGGTTARAGKEVTITRRNDPDHTIHLQMSNDPAKSLDSNVDIYPGDTVVVGRCGVIYVVGDVMRPAGFALDTNEKVTVLQALALAGGANPTARLNSARIIRKTGAGQKEIPMELSKIMAAQADDPVMQSDDILFVPRSGAKSAFRRGAEAAIGITSGLIIYRR
jgi:polysaccharide export outer membrane protein